MSFYVFKLNIQPNVLQEYEKNDELPYLKNDIVKQAFEANFEVKNLENYLQIGFLENDDTEFHDKFNDLQSMTEDLYEEYGKIVKQYIDSGEIYYSKKFLNLNERCGYKRRKLENEYPTLKVAYDIYDEKNIEKEYGLEFENSVGTGITHIQKFYKIDLYLKEMDTGPTDIYEDIKLFYKQSDELFYIETENFDKAINCAQFIEKSINKSKDANIHIGKISINPKYESIKFEGDLTEITYTVVYPNGDDPGKRHDILKDSEGKQKTTTIYGANGEPLKQEPISEELNKKGNQGYLRDFFAKGANIVKTILKVDNLP